MTDAPHSLPRFGPFTLDLETGDLRRGKALIALAPQPMAVLCHLVLHAGRTVSREQLRETVWGDTPHLQFEQSLNSCIRRLRVALDDDPQSPRFIETVPRRGYRFVGLDVATTGTSVATGTSDTTGTARQAPRVEGASHGRPTSYRQRWWPMILLTVVALTVAGWLLRPGATDTATKTIAETDPSRSTGPRLAVLPIAYDDEGDRAFLATGLTEALHARLHGLAGSRLRLLGLSTGMALTDPRYAAEVEDALRIEGQLRETDTATSIALTLHGADGQLRWQGQEDIVGAVSIESALATLDRLLPGLGTAILGESVGALPAPASSSDLPAAREAFLRGRYLESRGDLDSLTRAEGDFARAALLDPDFVDAWAYQARVVSALAWRGGLPDPERIAEARALGERALSRDPSHGEAHLALGFLALFFDWDVEAADAHFDQAASATPGEARVHGAKAAAAAAAGDARRAVDQARLAEALDPLDMVVQSDLCWYLAYADQLDEAADACRRALGFAPGNTWIRIGLAVAEAQRDPKAAIDTWLTLLAPSDAPLDAWRVGATDDPGATLDAILDWFATRQTTLLGDGGVQPLHLASVQAMAGQTDLALATLTRAIEAREAFSVFLALDPRFDRLRSTPGFTTLLRTAGLATAASTD